MVFFLSVIYFDQYHVVLFYVFAQTNQYFLVFNTKLPIFFHRKLNVLELHRFEILRLEELQTDLILQNVSINLEANIDKGVPGFDFLKLEPAFAVGRSFKFLGIEFDHKFGLRNKVENIDVLFYALL